MLEVTMPLGPANIDPHDERALMGFTAGVLWLVAALTAAVGALLPGAPETVTWMFLALEVLVIVSALACIKGLIRWEQTSMTVHAVTTGALLPLVGLTMWSTGGTNSFVYPLVLFPLLHIAYFFPVRMSVPLIVELTLVYASPLLYAGDPTAHAFPARALAFAVAAAVLTVVVRGLKNRLLSAESSQRHMARTDVLTGLANRRGFDDALSAAIGAAGEPEVGRRASDVQPGTVLLLLDLDDFKGVNDAHGHARGDDLLRAVAAQCHAVVRPGDTLARIGGDEFALVAPGAGEPGAQRLAHELADAIGRAGAQATVAWAVHPVDGTDQDALLRAADRRLYAAKPASRSYAYRFAAAG
jgi:diguanylate cyclase (GGDEF)-like protein